MTLDRAPLGRAVIIVEFLDRRMLLEGIRLGLTEGAVVVPIERIPGGPTILEIGNRELAVGGELARAILVRLPSKKVTWAGRP